MIDFYNTGNWLVPPEEWDNDLNGIPNDYYTLARKAKLIVIGFSHTHPEANFSGAGTLSRSYDVKQHSVNDFKISKNRRLPDVIIKVSVSVNKNTMARMTTVDLNLITKDALTPNDVKTLPPLEEFCKNIDYNVFNYIIKNYKDAPGK